MSESHSALAGELADERRRSAAHRAALRQIEERAQSGMDGSPSGGEWSPPMLRGILAEIRDAARGALTP